jgi:aspartate kinase
MLVMKFGGTSVKDAAAIGRVVEIIRRARDIPSRDARHAIRGPLVVVSALSRVTDALLKLVSLATQGDEREAAVIVGELRQRHHDAAGAVGDAGRRRNLCAALDRDLEELATLAHGLSVVRDATPRLQDAVAATGELMSSRIVASALEDRGLPVCWVDPRDVLVTDAATPALPLMAATRARGDAVLRPRLDAGDIPTIGGFVGATRDGITTTLGRGGSDYSASVLGVAVNADEIQIWTDVDGMLTADPRVIEGTRPVPEISFGEASELAYFGAKVLHPSTILPAVTENIPVRILNSHRPEVPGTLITATAAPSATPLTAIACKREVVVIDIVSTRMLMAHGFLRRLFEVFERHETAVDVVTTSEVSVSVTIDDRRRLDDIVEELSTFAEVTTTNGMALVCAVGDMLRNDPSLSGRVLSALGGIPLRMVSQAASRRNVTLVLPEAHLVDAVARLHHHFCTPRSVGEMPETASPDAPSTLGVMGEPESKAGAAR